MLKSIKYSLIFVFFFCCKVNFAQKRTTVRCANRHFSENEKKYPAYEGQPYEALINSVFFSSLNSLQISRPQPTRSVHFARELFVSIYKFSSEISAVTQKCYRSNVEHSTRLKLILFPFHVFW